jgi:hypothetical protein
MDDELRYGCGHDLEVTDEVFSIWIGDYWNGLSTWMYERYHHEEETLVATVTCTACLQKI